MKKFTKRLITKTALFFSISLILPACSHVSLFGSQGPISRKSRVLIVGDSHMVGGFGEKLQNSFINYLGPDKVAVYGYCGASVEHFLKDEPVFICKCGQRVTTERQRILDNWNDGKKPRPVPTPKLADLLRQHRPQILIVQLGTNNFDSLQKEGAKSIPKQRSYFDRLAREMTSSSSSVKRVIWVSPPDSTKFPSNIERMVDRFILEAARKHRFNVIRSRKITNYVMGKTGTDGVHYHTKPAEDWAIKVIFQLNQILRRIEAPSASAPR